jgi:hypothetical protein
MFSCLVTGKTYRRCIVCVSLNIHAVHAIEMTVSITAAYLAFCALYLLAVVSMRPFHATACTVCPTVYELLLLCSSLAACVVVSAAFVHVGSCCCARQYTTAAGCPVGGEYLTLFLTCACLIGYCKLMIVADHT